MRRLAVLPLALLLGCSTRGPRPDLGPEALARAYLQRRRLWQETRRAIIRHDEEILRSYRTTHFVLPNPMADEFYHDDHEHEAFEPIPRKPSLLTAEPLAFRIVEPGQVAFEGQVDEPFTYFFHGDHVELLRSPLSGFISVPRYRGRDGGDEPTILNFSSLYELAKGLKWSVDLDTFRLWRPDGNLARFEEVATDGTITDFVEISRNDAGGVERIRSRDGCLLVDFEDSFGWGESPAEFTCIFEGEKLASMDFADRNNEEVRCHVTYKDGVLSRIQKDADGDGAWDWVQNRTYQDGVLARVETDSDGDGDFDHTHRWILDSEREVAVYIERTPEGMNPWLVLDRDGYDLEGLWDLFHDLAKEQAWDRLREAIARAVRFELPILSREQIPVLVRSIPLDSQIPAPIYEAAAPLAGAIGKDPMTDRTALAIARIHVHCGERSEAQGILARQIRKPATDREFREVLRRYLANLGD